MSVYKLNCKLAFWRQLACGCNSNSHLPGFAAWEAAGLYN
jgi:hypothetical protein